MPPEKHAKLSASSAHRWMNCNPSANLEREFADRTSEAAAEGSAAHALCEHKLRKALKMRSTRPVSKYDSDEMEMYTDSYVEFVLERIELAKQHCMDPFVLIEQRLDFSCYVPDGFGTGDCLIVADKLLHIIDFKYGLGVLVEAAENPQMMLYALGALRLFDDRGIMLDMTMVHQAIACDDQFKRTHMEQARSVTGLENPNSPAQLKEWLAERGVEAESLSKAAVLQMLEEADGEVELALSLRQELANG